MLIRIGMLGLAVLVILLPAGARVAEADTNLIIYSYDNLDRLTTVQFDNGTTIHYTYDLMGNRLTRQVMVAPQISAPLLPEAAPLVSPPLVDLFNGLGALPGADSTPGGLPQVKAAPLPAAGASAADQASGPRVAALSPGSGAPVPEAAPAPQGTLPPPENLGLVSARGKVTMIWQAAGGNVTGFVIQRQEAASQDGFAQIARVPLPKDAGGRMQWTDHRVQTGKTYRYRVAAAGDSGASSFSRPLEVTVR